MANGVTRPTPSDRHGVSCKGQLGDSAMWIQVNDSIWAAPMPPSVKIVALAIASHMGEEQQVAWPSEGRLATMTGLAKRSVIRSVKWLIDHECLSIQKMKQEKSIWPVNNYRFRNGLKRLSANLSSSANLSLVPKPTGDTVPESGDTVPLSGDTMAHESVMNQ
jgi:hypothetical protein